MLDAFWVLNDWRSQQLLEQNLICVGIVSPSFFIRKQKGVAKHLFVSLRQLCRVA